MFKKARYVLAVYKEGSFTRAAEALYISQPCLSAAIKQIEDEIGARLFDRTTARVQPTAIGLSYIKTAEEIVALSDAFSRELRERGAALAGQLRVGGSNYVCSYILPPVIEAFSTRYPRVTLSVTEGSSAELFEMMRRGELDAVVDSFDRTPEGVSYTPLLEEQILLAVPRSLESNAAVREFAATPTDIYRGEAVAMQEISLAHFARERFVLLKAGNSMNEHAFAAFKESGITPRVGMFLDQLSTSYFLCAQGGGCAFVTDTMFKYHQFDDPILLYRVKGGGKRSFGVAYKRDKYISPTVSGFLDVVKEHIAPH